MSSIKGRLNVKGSYEFTDIRVLDAAMKEVTSGTHPLSETLDSAIYRVVAQIPGDRAEQLVVVQAGQTTTVKVDNLHLDSVIPHYLCGSRQEYQADEAIRVSRETHVVIGDDPAARLFVFIRTRGDPRTAIPTFELKNQMGDVLATSAAGECRPDLGCMAICVNLPAGTYQLEHHLPGLGRRAQAFFVEDHWETQMFVPWGEIPDFASAVIHMRRGIGFDPQQAELYAKSEAALNGLADHKMILSRKDRDQLLVGKLQDPMLGLIGAYAILLSEKSQIRFERIGEAVRHLSRLIPHSPDVKLLRVLAETKGGMDTSQRQSWPQIEEPPWFAIGTEYLMNLAAQHAGWCPADSWPSQVSLSLTTGSPWTRWTPVVAPGDAIDRLKREAEILVHDYSLHLDGFIDQFSSELNVSRFNSVDLGNINESIEANAKALAQRLAPKFSLPQSVVLEAIKQMMPEKLLVEAVFEKTIEHMADNFLNQFPPGKELPRPLKIKLRTLLDRWIFLSGRLGTVFDRLCAATEDDLGSIRQVEELFSV